MITLPTSDFSAVFFLSSLLDSLTLLISYDYDNIYHISTLLEAFQYIRSMLEDADASCVPGSQEPALFLIFLRWFGWRPPGIGVGAEVCVCRGRGRILSRIFNA